METDRYGPVKESRAAKPGAPNQEAAMETDRYGPVKDASHRYGDHHRPYRRNGDRPLRAGEGPPTSGGLSDTIMPQWRPTATGR